MGREVRRVPPNWNHPSDDSGLIPMLDETIDDALGCWLDDLDRVRRGEWTELEMECYPTLADWLSDHQPPNKEQYRPWRDEEATWFQIWETVSEGTPVTPAFETREELVNYLVDGGDDWDRKENRGGVTREQAEAFVNAGWAPSFVLVSTSSGSQMMRGIEAAQIFKPDDGEETKR